MLKFLHRLLFCVGFALGRIKCWLRRRKYRTFDDHMAILDEVKLRRNWREEVEAHGPELLAEMAFAKTQWQAIQVIMRFTERWGV